MESSFSRWRSHPIRSAILAAAAVAGLGLLLAATSVTAGTLTIQYQITGGSFDGAPLANPGGTYTVRFTATGPGTVVSGPATLLTLNPSSGLVPSLVLGQAGAGGLIVDPSYTHQGTVSRSAITGPGITTRPTCYLPSCYFGWQRTTRHTARWLGAVGTGLPGSLSVLSSTLKLSVSGDAWYNTATTHSGTYVGNEINTSYVPEPSTLPLVVGGLALFAVVTGRRRLL